MHLQVIGFKKMFKFKKKHGKNKRKVSFEERQGKNKRKVSFEKAPIIPDRKSSLSHLLNFMEKNSIFYNPLTKEEVTPLIPKRKSSLNYKLIGKTNAKI